MQFNTFIILYHWMPTKMTYTSTTQNDIRLIFICISKTFGRPYMSTNRYHIVVSTSFYFGETLQSINVHLFQHIIEMFTIQGKEEKMKKKNENMTRKIKIDLIWNVYEYWWPIWHLISRCSMYDHRSIFFIFIKSINCQTKNHNRQTILSPIDYNYLQNATNHLLLKFKNWCTYSLYADKT